MESKRRQRERRAARAETQVPPLPLLLVVCEGRETEPQYVEGFRAWCKNPRVTVVLEPGAGVPLTLVERAKALKLAAEEAARREQDQNLCYEQVFCVFDIDEHPNVPAARQLAVQSGLSLAVSNPCFDLWCLLHYRDSPGMRHRRDIQKMLASYQPGVRDKHLDFDKLIPGYADAVARAERLDREASAAGEDGRNPTTGVFRLTAAIDQSSRRPRLHPDRATLAKEKADAAARAALEQAARELASTDSSR